MRDAFTYFSEYTRSIQELPPGFLNLGQTDLVWLVCLFITRLITNIVNKITKNLKKKVKNKSRKYFC